MTTSPLPSWLRYSERAFAVCFVIFSFVMISKVVPTGFASTFSTLAFVFALPIFLYRLPMVELNRFEFTGVVLFGWLLLSVLWSNASVLQSLWYLGEYRIYLILPVMTSVLALSVHTQFWAFAAAMLGAFIALITSYGLGLGWWHIEGAHLSLANRIYHGFVMSSFLLACLLVARETTGVVRLVAGIVALLIVYNVLNIENGRTGYLQVVAVCLAFAILTFSRIQALFAVVAAVILFTVSYFTFDQFHTRVNQTVANVEKMVVSDDYNSSAGYRLEFYRGAINVGMDYPVGGVGVGDVTSTLQSRVEAGDIRVLTDNVHSEFMNMLMAGGISAILLFAGFIGSIAYSGFAVRRQSRWLGDALIGLGVIIFVSALFNSTIKDYGEKHALIIMLSILGGHLAHRGLHKRSEVGDVTRPLPTEKI